MRTTKAPETAPPTQTLKVLYLLNTFPKPSETFVQREVRALTQLDLDLHIHSLWGGEIEFEGHPVSVFKKRKLLELLVALPYWLIRNPRAFATLAGNLFRKKPGSLTDAGATLLGIGFALVHARTFMKAAHRPQLIHAGWAAMPATAAQVLSALTGIPFTFQAHAYDIFRNGGDWLLETKLGDARQIVTSSDYAREALIARGAEAEKVMTIRRTLPHSAPLCRMRTSRSPLRLLSIGRLVEKKGFERQLEILADLKRSGLHFEARIIGGGPLEQPLRDYAKALGLARQVTFLGARSHTACRQQLQWADVFVFTGEVAGNGDRDGLPNVIAEAMACGVPVVSTPIAGVPEAVHDHETGLLIPGGDPKAWTRALVRLRDDDVFYQTLRAQAREWVQAHFDPEINAKRLAWEMHRAARPELIERRLQPQPNPAITQAVPLHRRRASDRIDYRRPEHVS